MIGYIPEQREDGRSSRLPQILPKHRYSISLDSSDAWGTTPGSELGGKSWQCSGDLEVQGRDRSGAHSCQVYALALSVISWPWDSFCFGALFVCLKLHLVVFRIYFWF